MKFQYRRRPARELVVVSDVDGTIMQLRPGVKKIPYNDGPALLREQVPNQVVVDRLLQLEDSGFAVRFCSGRGEALRDVTVQQLEAAGFRKVAQRLVLQDRFTTVPALTAFKRDELVDWQAVLHIGDQSFDMHAAAEAGCAFMHVDDFAAGESLDFMFCWTCGCTVLRACRGSCSWATPRTCSRCARPGEAQLHDFAEVRA